MLWDYEEALRALHVSRNGELAEAVAALSSEAGTEAEAREGGVTQLLEMGHERDMVSTAAARSPAGTAPPGPSAW